MSSIEDLAERLRWQLERETGLRVEMTVRMEEAEKKVDELQEELRVALHDIETAARTSNDARARVRRKAEQQLADSLKSENATRAQLEKTERELAQALVTKRTALARCNVLQKERNGARSESKNPLPESRKP